MRIAFDLDDTLIAGAVRFPAERQPFLSRLLRHEPIRLGTTSLMTSLIRDGWEIWIYTTSFRSPWYVKSLFRLYGIPLTGVINQNLHIRKISRSGHAYQYCSKYPPDFSIALLVDESEGVWLEGRRYGFEVCRVHPNDDGWAAAVRAATDRLKPPDGGR